jgi:hypothetical protein
MNKSKNEIQIIVYPTDIDECKENPATCPKTRPVCINLQGSYTCQARNESSLLGPSVTCPAGYKFNTAQQTCEGTVTVLYL